MQKKVSPLIIVLAIAAMGGAFLALTPTTQAVCKVPATENCNDDVVQDCNTVCEYGYQCRYEQFKGYVWQIAQCNDAGSGQQGQNSCQNGQEKECFAFMNCYRGIQCNDPSATCGTECPHTSSYWECQNSHWGSTQTAFEGSPSGATCTG